MVYYDMGMTKTVVKLVNPKQNGKRDVFARMGCMVELFGGAPQPSTQFFGCVPIYVILLKCIYIYIYIDWRLLLLTIYITSPKLKI